MKNRDEILVKLSEIFVELFELEEDQVSLNAHLYDDLDIDSIDAVDLVVELKKLTGKKIRPEDFKSVRTVKDTVDAIEDLLA